MKVFLDQPTRGARDTWDVQIARGESRSFQLLVAAQGKEIHNVQVNGASPASGAGALHKAGLQVQVRLVGYVLTRPDDPRPWGAATKIGWWPDPLLPNRPFDVRQGETQPVWVTLFAPLGTPPGKYAGKISVTTGSGQTADATYEVEVFGVDLPGTQRLQNAAFMPASLLEAHYHVPGGLYGPAFLRLYKRWATFAFRHHLGPTFDMLMGWNQLEPPKRLAAKTAGPHSALPDSPSEAENYVSWPVVSGRKGYDFRTAGELADLGEKYGMKRFCIAIFDRHQTWEQQGEKTRAAMADLLRAYLAFLRARGIEGQAYVYNVDEPGPEMWETVKKNFEFVHSVDPQLKVWLCLNDINGVKALAGYSDIWDVYIRQYEQSGIEARRQAGDPVVWAVCIWPYEHPNLFIEYPAMDARVIGWLTYLYGVSGFEYWGLNYWGPNTGQKSWAPFERGDTRTRWKGAHWALGDGWLLYPGPDGEPLSSVRFENLSEGFEDAELLLMLDSKGNASEARRIAERVARSTSDFTSDPQVIESAHAALLKSLDKPRH
ncbi:MAG TPA: glycoside hydrolase domain-containing protein [Terriglobia bacterium]|nr:glycoside hydrolase domain-containing protein [Terriglobia bacterium]